MIRVFIIYLFFFNTLFAENFKLEKVINGLQKPWSLSFIDNKNLLITEKSGNIKLVNLNNNEIKALSHNLDVLEDGQGGLMDILFKKDEVYVSYSEDRQNGKSSTSVAKASFNKTKLNFKNIFRAEPPINSGFHFCSRLVVKD